MEPQRLSLWRRGAGVERLGWPGCFNGATAPIAVETVAVPEDTPGLSLLQWSHSAYRCGDGSL